MSTPTTNGGTTASHPSAMPTGSPATSWQIDAAASRVEFTIGKRLLFVKKLTVRGRFAEVGGTICLDERDPGTACATVTIGAASIDTQLARRDTHLRGADFFDVQRHPTLRFTSQRITTLERAGRYRLMGDLTIRGITREVHLEGDYLGPERGARTPRIRLRLTGSLNRRDFDLHWKSPIMTIADAVTIELEVQAAMQA